MKKTFLIIVLLTITVFAQTELLNQSNQLFGLSNISPKLKVSNTIGKKKVATAILYSMILPGMGELYAGNYSSGKYFTVAEGLLWASYAGARYFANHLQDNYKTFANTNAGITSESKNSDYWVNIGLYNNVDDYNFAMVKQGNYRAMYNNSADAWNWSSEDNKARYRSMWKSTENVRNNSNLLLSVLVLNRIASAINAVRLVTLYNKGLEANNMSLSFDLNTNPDNSQGVVMNFSLPLK